ncbi:MAG TPA: hypothetical protein VHV83_00650 [Armatimonadota bacterium]|nr:hypothetical protein [Armatimonadota bacterium]
MKRIDGIMRFAWRITGVLIGGVLGSLLLCSHVVCAGGPLQLSAPGIKLLAQENGSVILQNMQGTPRITFDGYCLAWVPPATNGGTPSVVTTADGKQAIQVDYKVKDDTTGRVRMQAQFTPSPYRVHLRYDIWGPDDLKVGGAMIARQPAVNASPQSLVKAGLWTRDTDGGVPYETPDMRAVQYQWGDEKLILSLPGGNLGWQDGWSMHFPPKKADAGHFVAEGDVMLITSRPAAAAAWLAGRPLALDIWTDTPYNLWESAAKPLALQTQTVNTSSTARAVTLAWWARDFNGKLVAQANKTQQLTPGQAWNETLSFPAPRRGILFVEVQAKSGTDEVFSRTNLAVLPPHKFLSGDESIFGLSNYFALPNKEAVEQLMHRIGVRWLRFGSLAPERLAEFGITQNHHSQVPLTDAGMQDTAKRQAWLTQQLAQADAKHAMYWEMGNELNMSGGIGKGALAERYVKEYLLPADDIRKQSGARVKLMSVGLAGGDTGFLDKLYEAGGWNHLDAIAIHPGRGNYTPDYGGDTWQVGEHGDYWNFLGSIKKVKETVAKYGEKPIFITEAYTCTHPNDWWNDTNRTAAENVVLQYALAAAEGVRVMDFYQLNDSVWWDQGGVNPKDREYYFGMLNRDLSPKPVLLGYATIAEALDQSKFVRWLKFTDPNTKGLLFNTPRGPMAILWSRADGYMLNTTRQGEHFATPEAWQNVWKTKVPVTLHATGAQVREIDCIGQERIISAKNGRAQLTLHGAPHIYYGLSSNIGQ